MIVQQVEKHMIKKNHPHYRMFCEFTHHQNIIAVGSFIERIGTFRKGIFVDFTNDGDWNRVTIITEGLVQPPRASTTF